MQYRILGRTGLRVAELCLGTMTFGEEWGFGAAKEECAKIFDAYVKAGGNFIDAANHYTDGTSEKIVGEFIHADRERFVVATKYTLGHPNGDPNAAGNHRKSMMQSLNGSLKRLNTDYIDLYWVHAWDGITPIDELMRALDDMVRAGKVLYVGISDAPAWVIARANTMADFHGWTPFSAIQVQYSLIERAVERELLPMANELDLAVAAWSPLGGGVLSGKYSKNASPSTEPARFTDNPMTPAFVNQRTLAIAAEVQVVADEVGKSPVQVALAWLRQRRGVVIPIIGARKLSQVTDSLGCTEWALSPSHVERLNHASQIELGFPHDFLASAFVREVVHAGMYDAIINHRDR